MYARYIVACFHAKIVHVFSEILVVNLSFAGNPWKCSRPGSPGSPAHAEHNERSRLALHQQQNFPATQLEGETTAKSCLIMKYYWFSLNYTKHVFIKGSVGTGVGAKPALFSDVRETFFNRVWTPLPFLGYSCCGQTGKAYHAFCP